MCNKIYKEVLRLVAEETEISADLITSKSRQAEVVDARQLVVWFCFKAGLRPQAIAEKLCISRQAVCHKLATIDGKLRLRSFRFNFDRINATFNEVFKEGCK